MQSKPFAISKRQVWEAYKRVKANGGAAGVDDQSLEEFEADLANNLYRLWNRMSSGSYFPPPVRRVEIPKRGGGVRPLGDTHGGGSHRTSRGESGVGAGVGEAFPF